VQATNGQQYKVQLDRFKNSNRYRTQKGWRMVKDHRPSLSHAKNHISSSQVENKNQETNAGESRPSNGRSQHPFARDWRCFALYRWLLVRMHRLERCRSSAVRVMRTDQTGRSLGVAPGYPSESRYCWGRAVLMDRQVSEGAGDGSDFERCWKH
jgi:hypothetical protein